MPSLHSPSSDINYHNRIARACVLNAVPIPEKTRAILESRGVNIDELTTRLQDSIGFQR